MLAPLLALLLAQTGTPEAGRLEAVRKLQAEGRCREAIPVLKELVRTAPAASDARFLLGQCLFEEGEYRVAEPVLRQAVAAQPDSALARYFLGSALGLSGRMPEAIEQLQEATQRDPGMAPAFRVLGMFRFQSGQYGPGTRLALETALRLDPQDARAEYWFGRYLLEMTEYADARVHLERALAMTPQSSQVRVAYAQTLNNLGETASALREYDAVLAREPDEPAALLGRAKCLYAGQEFEPAVAAAERALRVVGQSEVRRDVLWLLGRLYQSLDRTAQAEAVGRELAELDAAHDRQQARFRELQELAMRYRAAHETQKLIETLEESLRILERQDSLLILGDAYMEVGRVADAEQCFLRALQHGPELDSIKRRLRLLRERYGVAR